MHGIMAAFRMKAWAHSNGWQISLGTIGVERFWRNIQRMARNKGRSGSNPQTINLILLLRWLRNIQSRLGHLEEAGRVGYNAAKVHSQSTRLLVRERLAGAFNVAHGVAPRIAMPQPAGISEAGIGIIYKAFTEGRV